MEKVDCEKIGRWFLEDIAKVYFGTVDRNFVSMVVGEYTKKVMDDTKQIEDFLSNPDQCVKCEKKEDDLLVNGFCEKCWVGIINNKDILYSLE